MSLELSRLSIRSVDTASIVRLNKINSSTRLPLSLLIEEGIELLWERYIEDEGGVTDVG